MTVLMIWILSGLLVGLCGVIVFLILGQDVRGGGLAGALGGGSVQSAFGSRTTETVLKVTAYLVAAIFLTVIVLAKLQPQDTSQQGLTDREGKTPATAPADTTDTTDTTEE